jgi:beta-phosphoglucomutase-like phosphatase (HAD superfamily)
MEFDAVIFDLDGTLLDTESLSDEAMIRALESAGYPVSFTYFRFEFLTKYEFVGGH